MHLHTFGLELENSVHNPCVQLTHLKDQYSQREIKGQRKKDAWIILSRKLEQNLQDGTEELLPPTML